MKRKTSLALWASAIVFGVGFYAFYNHSANDATTSAPSSPSAKEKIAGNNAAQPEDASSSPAEAAKTPTRPLIDNPDEILALAKVIQTEGWKVGCAQAEPRLEEFKTSLLTQPHVVDPAWEEMVFISAGCLSEIHLDEKSAIEILKKALELKPRDAQFINMLGTSYFRNGQDVEAEQALASILADNELSNELWNSGWAGAVHEKLAIVKLRLGTETRDTERLNEARHLLQTADEFEGLTNVSPLRHGQIAAVDFSLGRYEQALAGYEKALTLLDHPSTRKVWSPEMINKMKAEYTMETGQIHFMQGQAEKAAETMQRAIDYAEQSTDPLLVNTMKALYANTLHGTPVDVGKFNEIKRVPLE